MSKRKDTVLFKRARRAIDEGSLEDLMWSLADMSINDLEEGREIRIGQTTFNKILGTLGSLEAIKKRQEVTAAEMMDEKEAVKELENWMVIEGGGE